MTDDERKLLRIHRTHPYKGRNTYGGGKTTGVCPHCGAGPRYFDFIARWKACMACGLDNMMERVFTSARFDLRSQRDVDPALVTKALKYGLKVYGDPDE